MLEIGDLKRGPNLETYPIQRAGAALGDPSKGFSTDLSGLTRA